MLTRPLLGDDAFTLCRKIARSGRFALLLESGQTGSAGARYSFIGCEPYAVLSGHGDQTTYWTPDGTTQLHVGPLMALTELLEGAPIERPPGIPPFFGGVIGVLSYDLVRQFERLPTLARDDLGTPDILFACVDLVVAIDHLCQTLHLLYTPPPSRWRQESPDRLYREGWDRLAQLNARLSTPLSDNEDDEILQSHAVVHAGQTREDYIERVKHCQEYIRAGDVYQANLSHRFTLEPQHGPLSSWAVYGRLRRINPSPFAALLIFPELSIVSCSPERLIRVDGWHVETRPIAGTRWRGTSEREDERLIEELRSDPKERAEHLMLVDLERNDLGRVCRVGSVAVNEFMGVERYSHVSHLVSNVTGVLRDEIDFASLVRAVFPGGTITGVPKVRCMEIIEELEPVRRGAYSGSAGYVSWSGDADLNILIRTITLTGSRGFFQVGAGIVADSDPEREYEETLYKAAAMLEAVRGER